MAGRRGGVTVPISTEFNNRGLEQANRQLTAFGKSVRKSFVGIGATLGGAFALGAVTDQMRQMIDAGSRLQESQSKVNVVFGQSAKRINEWSDSASTAMVMSKQAALEAAGTFGNLFQAFGIGQGKATEMSTTLVQLAADLASFNNTSTDEAIQALRSGLSGETEPLKRYGVALNDARLKQEALNMGIYDGKGALDANQKSLAAYELILKDTRLAQGDVARTADNYANTMRSVQAAVENAQAIIGTELVAAITDVSTAIGGPQGMTQGIEGAAQAVADLIDISNDAIGPLTTLAGAIDDVVPDFMGGFFDMGWDRVFGPLGGVVDGLILAKDASEMAGRANELLTQGYVRMAPAMSNATEAATTATTALDKQKSAADKLKESLDRLNGKDRSVIAQRLSIRRTLAGGPSKSGQRKGADGKMTSFTTKDDRLAFALDIAGQFEGLASAMEADGATGAQIRKTLNRGGRVLDGIVGKDMSDRLLSTPKWLDRGNAGQRASGERYGAMTTVYQFGDIRVDNIEQAIEQARRAARLKALGNGRVAEAARYTALAGG